MGPDLSIVFATLTEIVGDFGFKRFADTGRINGFLQGLGGYIGVIFFLISSFKGANVMYVNGMWDGVSGILESLAAYVFLGDRLNISQYIGIGFITVGLILLKLTGGKGK